jgi:hypothetical protein
MKSERSIPATIESTHPEVDEKEAEKVERSVGDAAGARPQKGTNPVP